MKQRLFLVFSTLIAMELTGQNSTDTIIDAHCHIKTQSNESFKDINTYLSQNHAVNIKYVFGITFAGQGNIHQTIAQNDSLLLIAKTNPKFIPVCSVHPYDGEDALKELDRISILGVRVIKLHPVIQDFQILDERVLRMIKYAGAKNIVILICSYSFIQQNNIEKLLTLALINPDTKFIFAHLGLIDFDKFSAFKLVKKQTNLFRNVWFDISVTVNTYADSPYEDQLVWVMRQVGIERIFFGSDDPAYPLSEALTAFYKLDLNHEERKLILYKNALNFIKTNRLSSMTD